MTLSFLDLFLLLLLQLIFFSLPLFPPSPLPSPSFCRSVSCFTNLLFYDTIDYSICLFIALRDSSQSVLLTETFNWNWNQNYLTLEALLKKDLICSYMLMPSMIGLKMAEDLNLGVA